MIRDRVEAETALHSKPRASGDDPWTDPGTRIGDRVNPARAGMIRSMTALSVAA